MCDILVLFKRVEDIDALGFVRLAPCRDVSSYV